MADNTTEKILENARALFESQGFSATSMRQIAEQTGIGKATIYHHFTDKQSLFLALLERAGNGLRFNPADLAAETDPHARIQKATLACISFLAGMMELMNIARREVPEARAKLQSENSQVFRGLSIALSDSIQVGIDQKVFRRVHPQQTAQVLFAMIQGTYAIASLSGTRIQSPEKTAAAILEIFFQGLDAR
jgi:AcrR family transcriptional regulator